MQGFAGAHTPAFVVRQGRPRWPRSWERFRRGSHPGLRCASMSVSCSFQEGPSFAGAHTPAFVVRLFAITIACGRGHVSPGLTPRPSLCGVTLVLIPILLLRFRRGSHPGLRCAALADLVVSRFPKRFAGAHTPAFVVRSHLLLISSSKSRFRRGSHPGLRCASVTFANLRTVLSFRRGSHPGLRCATQCREAPFGWEFRFAGAHTPAFVVRPSAGRLHSDGSSVSPGLTPRPSLCARHTSARRDEAHRFAGAHTPAFVVR